MLEIIKYLGYISIAVILLAVIYLVFVLTGRDLAGLTQGFETIEVGDETRRYRVYDPAPNTPNKPLVFAFHGLNDRGKFIEVYTGLSNLARQEEFVVVYPEGVGQSWNGDFCCGLAWQQKIDDVSFIRELSAKLQTEHSVDSSRIYALGFSNGGLFTQHLLSEAPDLFAAGVSAMAGAGDGQGNMLDVSGAVAPILLMNGTNDRFSPLTEPYENKPGFQFIPAADTWNAWTEHYELGKATLENSPADPDVTTYGDNQVVTKLYESKHRWPQWRLWSFQNEVPDSTREAWEFLQQNQLR